VLLVLLALVPRFGDAAFCLLTLVLWWIVTREKGVCNFTFSQKQRDRAAERAGAVVGLCAH